MRCYRLLVHRTLRDSRLTDEQNVSLQGEAPDSTETKELRMKKNIWRINERKKERGRLERSRGRESIDEMKERVDRTHAELSGRVCSI